MRVPRFSYAAGFRLRTCTGYWVSASKDANMTETRPAKRERVKRYDILKGIAMLLVIWGHISSLGNNFIYSFHMPVFFILSGYFFSHVGNRELLAKDFKRLLMPYIATCLSILVLSVILKGNTYRWILASLWGSGSNMYTARYFSFVPHVGAIWFLLGLFWCRLAFNSIAKLGSDRRMLLAVCVLFLLATLTGRYLIVAPLSILPGICALPFMYFGYYSKRHAIGKRMRYMFIAVWIPCAVFSHLSIARCHFEWYFVDIVGGIGGYFVFMKLSSALERLGMISTILTFIGRNSIVYLCVHLIVNIFFRIPVNTVLFFAFHVAVCSVVVVLLSLSKTTRELFKISLH